MYFSFSTAVIQSLLHGPGITDQEIVIESHPRIKNNSYGYQLYFWIHEGRIWIRHYHNLQGWSSWTEIATNVPYFYKSYNNLTSFGTALAGLTSFATSLGENTGGIRYKRDSKTVSSTSDESFTIDVSVGGFGFLVARNDVSGVCAIYACTRSTLVEIAPSPYVGAVKLNDTTIAVKAKQNAYLSLNYLIFGI